MTIDIRKFVELVSRVHNLAPVVEFGAARIEMQDSLADLRPFFSEPYIGCDRNAGLGINVRADAMLPPFASRSFKTVVCCEMLEHCLSPMDALQAMAGLVDPEGVMIVSTPFIFPIHHLPDLWRITPQGLDLLLEYFMPYHAVYFSGDLSYPIQVYGFATIDRLKFRTIERYLENTMFEMPAHYEGERIFRWTKEEDYYRLRRIEQSSSEAKASRALVEFAAALREVN